MKKGIISVLALGFALSLYSCDGSNSKKKADGDPIVMGDPSTIITETDSAHLKDLVDDLKPNEVPADTAQPVTPVDTTKKVDTAKAKPETPPATPPAPKGNGLTIAFKDVTIVIPGVTAKSVGNQDLQKANGATYQVSSGKVNGSSLQISGATITNVSQRYQSIVSIKNNLGTLELDELGTTTGWKTIKGNNGTYNIGVNENQLEAGKVNNNSVRRAISKEARQRRMNRKTQQQWEASAKNIRAANQKPMVTSLRAIMFKIDGKDKAGKSFSKQVRIDL